MHDSLYIAVEIGACFAAIITFLVTCLTFFRRWVLNQIARDISPHLTNKNDSAERYSHQARDAAEQARNAAHQAREAMYQAKQAAQEARDQMQALETRQHGDSTPEPHHQNRQG